MGNVESFFVGPGRGRWIPKSWTDLEEAVQNRTLDETTWVELKEKLGDDNRENAKDLASLALHSGLLVLGVPETSRGRAGKPCGVNLASTRQRVDQIARDRPDPPIWIECKEIPNPRKTGEGVLLVGVPASGPHMVDGHYWGRTDTGKVRLKDSDVREHLARKLTSSQSVIDDIRDLSNQFIKPTIEAGPTRRDLPRLTVRAVPVGGRRNALQDLFDRSGSNQGTMLIDLLRSPRVAGRRPGNYNPAPLVGADHWGPYACGMSLRAPHPGIQSFSRQILIHLETVGAFNLLLSPVGKEERMQFQDRTLPTVDTELVLAATHDILAFAGILSSEYAAFPGEWTIAVRVDQLEGFHDSNKVISGLQDWPPAYNGKPDYEDCTSATTSELLEQPWAVTERILGQFVRSLGAEGAYLPYEPGSQAARLLRRS